MDDAALIFISGDPAGPTGEAAAERPTALERFASILLGSDPFESSEDARTQALMAERLAADKLRRGRELFPTELARANPFRTLYGLAKDRAAKARPKLDAAEAATAERRLVAAMYRLRHRQRAALSLRHVFEMSETEVAFVLGVPPRVAASVIRTADAALSRAAGGPIDVPRALRSLGRTLTATGEPGADARTAAPNPARLPRAVFRRLLAPAPPGVADRPAHADPVVRAARPVYRLLEAAPPPAAPAGKPAPERGPRRRDRSSRERALAFAAVAAMLVLATLLPGSSVHAPMSPAPVAVVPLAPQLVEAPAALPPPAVPATSYRVRRGDALWTIAVRTLGDGYRWREIWRANAGRRMASGERFVDPDRIRPGWVLRLQRPAPTAGAG